MSAMTEKRSVVLLLADGTRIGGTLRFVEASRSRLILECENVQREYEGGDLYEAFILLRLDIEKDGHRILCMGARKDVSPSGMSRSMSNGRKAYLMRLGVPSKNWEIVDIFDYSGPDTIGTVEEQVDFKRCAMAKR